MKIDGNATRVTISEFEPGVVQIPFGPIPPDSASSIIPSLTTSTDDLLLKAELDRAPTEAQGLHTLVPVRITAKPEAFSKATFEYRDAEGTVKLMLGNGLAREMVVPVRIAAKPQPVADQTRVNYTREAERYQWKAQYRIKPTGSYSTANVSALSVFCDDDRLKAFAKGLELQTQSLTGDQFSLPITWNGPALDATAPEVCVAQVRMEIKDTAGTHPRNLRLELTLPRRVDLSDAIRIGAADRDLTKILNDDVVIAGTMTAASLRADASFSVLERNALVLQKLPITYDPSKREYIIPGKLVNLASLQDPSTAQH